MEIEDEAPLALHSWAKANAIYYSCKIKCGWSNKPCKAECLDTYNTQIADQNNHSALFETSPADSSLALHGYVEGNAVYYSCRAKCGVRATQDCKDKCL
jgi:beta-lactamase superfamily II metal-dependent hydrolase